MRGLKIDFTQENPQLVLDEAVEDQTATTQNVAVNIGTSKSAPIFDDKGTDLLKTMLESGYVSNRFAQHAANFAALDTHYFVKTYSPFSDGLSSVILLAPEEPSSATSFTLQTTFGDLTISGNITL